MGYSLKSFNDRLIAAQLPPLPYLSFKAVINYMNANGSTYTKPTYSLEELDDALATHIYNVYRDTTPEATNPLAVFDYGTWSAQLKALLQQQLDALLGTITNVPATPGNMKVDSSTVNVRIMFDGATSDDINTAISSVDNGALGLIMFMGGDYFLNKPIVIGKSNIHMTHAPFRGLFDLVNKVTLVPNVDFKNKSVIEIKGTSTVPLLNVVISNISIKGDISLNVSEAISAEYLGKLMATTSATGRYNATNVGSGFPVVNNISLDLSNLTVTGFPSGAIKLTNVYSSLIRMCTLKTTNYGIKMSRCADIRVLNNSLEGTTTDGIYSEHGVRMVISGNTIVGYVNGVSMRNPETRYTRATELLHSVSGNTFKGNGIGVKFTEGVYGSSVSGNLFYNSSVLDIELSHDSSHCTITNNTCMGSTNSLKVDNCSAVMVVFNMLMNSALGVSINLTNTTTNIQTKRNALSGTYINSGGYNEYTRNTTVTL